MVVRAENRSGAWRTYMRNRIFVPRKTGVEEPSLPPRSRFEFSACCIISCTSESVVPNGVERSVTSGRLETNRNIVSRFQWLPGADHTRDASSSPGWLRHLLNKVRADSITRIRWSDFGIDIQFSSHMLAGNPAKVNNWIKRLLSSFRDPAVVNDRWMEAEDKILKREKDNK